MVTQMYHTSSLYANVYC